MKIIIYVLLSIILAFVGLYTSAAFQEFCVSYLDLTNISLKNISIISRLNKVKIFAVSLGIVPLMLLFVERKARLKNFKERFIALAIILLCGIITWALRIFQLNFRFRSYSEYPLGDVITFTYDTGTLFFELYLLVGFLIGTLVSILFLRKRMQ